MQKLEKIPDRSDIRVYGVLVRDPSNPDWNNDELRRDF